MKTPLQTIQFLKLYKKLNIARLSYSSMARSPLYHDKAYVNGKWVTSKTGNSFKIYNPANGEVIGSVPNMTIEDTEEAVAVAYNTFQTWKQTTAKQRSLLLKKWFELMQKNADELAKLLTTENGKPLSDARSEIAFAAGFVEWYGEEGRRTYGETIPAPFPDRRMVVVKQPVGVAGLITPWNFPSAMISRKAAPALAAGCTVVIKPAEDTPYSALALCQLAEEAGIPPGVLNVVTCDRNNAPDVGRVLCENPLVAKISFTGSTATGKILLRQAASTVKRVSLELGGNTPFIVFDSANIEKAVEGLMKCKFRCSGQTCVCANRILVQEGVHDKFVAALSDTMNKELKVGDGSQAGVNQGPLINVKAVEKVSGLVDDAKANGATIVSGGQKHELGGNFFQPTLITEVKPDMRCSQEEVFGPVASIIKFKTEDEAVALANATSAGLAGYLFSQDMGQMWRVGEKLEYGIVGINEGMPTTVEAPHGGFKESGLGREGSKYGIEEFLEVKYMCFGNID